MSVVIPDSTVVAQLGYACLYAEDAFQAVCEGSGAVLLAPPSDPRLSPDWTVLAALVARDSVFRKSPTAGLRVFFGWVLRRTSNPADHLVVIRGTQRAVEWLKDLEAAETTPHRLAGKVHAGFWGLYSSMTLRTLDGIEVPLLSGIVELVGAGTVTIVGHSLGSAIATYGAIDLLSMLPGRVAMCLLASPRPGDRAFTESADAILHGVYQSFAIDCDIVPHVPFGFGYAALPNLTVLPADGEVFRTRPSLYCFHHILSYIAAIAPKAVNLSSLPACDSSYASCLIPQASLPKPAQVL